MYIQKCIFPIPAPEGRTVTLQLTFIPQVLEVIGFYRVVGFLCALWAQGWGIYIFEYNVGIEYIMPTLRGGM